MGNIESEMSPIDHGADTSIVKSEVSVEEVLLFIWQLRDTNFSFA